MPINCIHECRRYTKVEILKQFCSAFLEYIERNLRQSAMDIDRLLNLEVRIIITDFLSSVGCVDEYDNYYNSIINNQLL